MHNTYCHSLYMHRQLFMKMQPIKLTKKETIYKSESNNLKTGKLQTKRRDQDKL